jgi:CHASE3 domain sensor protein
MNSRRTIQAIAVLLLAAAVVTIVMAGREYRRDVNSLQNKYTGTVKKRDIIDAARNALSALQDAEAQMHNYVLTGETVYSEAYAEDIRTWEDESGTMEVEAQHDSSTPTVSQFAKDGARVQTELALIASLADKGPRDAALERIRKGSDIVYLGQARALLMTLQGLTGFSADETDQSLIRETLKSEKRLIWGAAALFCTTFAGAILLLLEIRRGARLAGAPESLEGRLAAAAK